MRTCRTAKGVSTVSEFQLLVMDVTTFGEFATGNISEKHKILYRWKVEKEIQEYKGKN
jgi:hypothetical protein